MHEGLRQLVREMMIQEITLADVVPEKRLPGRELDIYDDYRYSNKATTAWRRGVKKDWNKYADLSYFNDPNKVKVVHFLGLWSEETGGDEIMSYFGPKRMLNHYVKAGLDAGVLRSDDGSVENFKRVDWSRMGWSQLIAKMMSMRPFLKIPGIHIPARDELSCIGLRNCKKSPVAISWENPQEDQRPFFTFKKYRVTFVSNYDASTERLSFATDQDIERMRGSGLAKRPGPSYNYDPIKYPLDSRDSLDRMGEVVIDNWIVDTLYTFSGDDKALADSIGLKAVVL